MKRYIKPSIFVKKAGTRDFVLETPVVGGSNGTVDQWSKERIDSFDSNLSTGASEGTSGNFGSDNGPWESLW